MKYNINYQHVLDYVLGTSSYHPLEMALDPRRYEIHDDRIFDKSNNSYLPQEKDYCDFCSQVRWLKDYQSAMEKEQVFGACRIIAQKSFFTIFLNND
jgi:hypothetical protein